MSTKRLEGATNTPPIEINKGYVIETPKLTQKLKHKPRKAF